MFALNSASKFNIFQFDPTPVKLTVDCEINSWNETHSKQQVVYRHKRRKILRTIDETQSQQPNNSTNLAQLRSYKENLLKSTIKKLSQRTLPTSSPNSNPSIEPTRNGKRFQFYVRSLSRSNHQQKQQPIVISEFDPNANAEEKQSNELSPSINMQSDRLRVGTKMRNSRGKTISLPKRKKSENRCVSDRLASNSQASVGLRTTTTNPQSNGVSLVSRRLISSRN